MEKIFIKSFLLSSSYFLFIYLMVFLCVVKGLLSKNSYKGFCYCYQHVNNFCKIKVKSG